MSTSESKSAIDAASIDIVLIRLAHCSFQMNPGFQLDSEERIPVPFEFTIERDNPEPTKGVVRLGLGVFREGSESPFLIRVQYEGFFEVEEGGEAGLNEFMRYNALAMLVPYIRETISSLSTRGGFPPLIVPPINAQQLAEEHDDSKKESASPADTP